ncbi:MAG: PIN domain-containing protein [Acidobacteriota bacterium]
MVTPAELDAFLQKHKRIGIDSNVLIYFVEGHSRFGSLATRVFDRVEAGRNSAVCATVSLLEILVQPYRRDDTPLVNKFYGLLTTYPHLSFMDLTATTADLAARLRARYGLKTPDAIVIASAIQAGATGLVANDLRIKAMPEIDLLLLSA